MADTKLSELTELATTPATDDELYIRDVSEEAAAESKRITIANLLSSLPAVTLGGAVTINGQDFDAGAGSAVITTTGQYQGLVINQTYDGADGPRIYLQHFRASPSDNDYAGYLSFQAYDSESNSTEYGSISCLALDVTDTAEDARLDIYLQNSGAYNNALQLSGAGVLDVDASSGLGAATVGQFDEYDDAVILKDGISGKAFEKLEEIGVMSRKDTGSGWMMNVQAMSYLLAGGIYQNRAKIDSINERLGRLELALTEGRM